MTGKQKDKESEAWRLKMKGSALADKGPQPEQVLDREATAVLTTAKQSVSGEQAEDVFVLPWFIQV
jgi:hypothetical protein